MSELKRMLSGELYISSDDEIKKLAYRGRKLVEIYNKVSIDNQDERNRILKKLLGKVGQNAVLVPPIYFDYGSNTYIGESFYANTGLIILDVANVNIGNNVMIGPRVSIFTAGHPIEHTVRNERLEYGYEVNIGNNVWIGGNSVINPGVSIGDETVIGSGSVVTNNIPSGVVAAGNPCKVIREITQEEKNFWLEKRTRYYKSKEFIKCRKNL